MLQGQKPRTSNTSSISSPKSPPAEIQPFNASRSSQHSRQHPPPVDVTQSLPPRSMNPSAAASPPPMNQQQRPVQGEQSLPPRGSADAGPTKQALNYKRAPPSSKKGAKSTKKK